MGRKKKENKLLPVAFRMNVRIWKGLHNRYGKRLNDILRKFLEDLYNGTTNIS
jgi:hypothetical protein